jgi:HAD superfamily hydrolase (TIGR01549 family)
MKEKAILLDLFGTLWGATSPENNAMQYYGRDKSFHPQVQRAFCGEIFSSQTTWNRFLKGYNTLQDNANWENYFDRCCKSLKIESTHKNKQQIYEIIRTELLEKALPVIPEGRDDALRKLKDLGYILAIASHAYPPTKACVLEAISLSEFFSEKNIFASHQLGRLKSDKEFYPTILENLSISPENAIMIGDSWESDIHPTLKIGMHGVLCDFREKNYDTDGNLDGKIIVNNPENFPFYQARRFSEIPEIIKDIFQ